jgi:hypothetical protein
MEPEHVDISDDYSIATPGRVITGESTNPSAGYRVFPTTPEFTVPLQASNIIFPIPVRHIVVYNATSQTIYLDVDYQASPGSLPIASGVVMSLDAPCRYVSLFTTVASAINGVQAGNILVWGYR